MSLEVEQRGFLPLTLWQGTLWGTASACGPGLSGSHRPMSFTHNLYYLWWSPRGGQAKKKGILKGPKPPEAEGLSGRTGIGSRLAGCKSAQLPTSPPSLLHLPWVPPSTPCLLSTHRSQAVGLGISLAPSQCWGEK